MTFGIGSFEDCGVMLYLKNRLIKGFIKVGCQKQVYLRHFFFAISVFYHLLYAISNAISFWLSCLGSVCLSSIYLLNGG